MVCSCRRCRGLGGFAVARVQLSAALEADTLGALLVGVVNAVGVARTVRTTRVRLEAVADCADGARLGIRWLRIGS